MIPIIEIRHSCRLVRHQGFSQSCDDKGYYAAVSLITDLVNFATGRIGANSYYKPAFEYCAELAVFFTPFNDTAEHLVGAVRASIRAMVLVDIQFVQPKPKTPVDCACDRRYPLTIALYNSRCIGIYEVKMCLDGWSAKPVSPIAITTRF